MKALKIALLSIAVCAVSGSYAATPSAPPTVSVSPAAPSSALVSAPSGAAIVRKVADYQPCYGRVAGQRGTIVLRRIVMADGTQQWLTVNTATLATAIVPAVGFMTQVVTDPDSLDDGSAYFALRREIVQNYKVYQQGVSSHGGQGYMLTCDLCPSPKKLDRDFIEMLAARGVSPIYVCVSGRWIERHRQDLEWLLALQMPRILWVNHSYNHYYKPGAPDNENFLLRPDTDLRHEVLDNERLMVECGVTPTVFFRYPGLVSSPAVSRAVVDWGLIPLGADAWLAKGQSPQGSGSIILVHINGNEPQGLKLFTKWLITTTMLAEEFR